MVVVRGSVLFVQYARSKVTPLLKLAKWKIHPLKGEGDDWGLLTIDNVVYKMVALKRAVVVALKRAVVVALKRAFGGSAVGRLL